jgi:2-oxoglutarate/2-oxoacid ferredoxin oxidoreductase subunit alpha
MPNNASSSRPVEYRDSLVIRFAGDSGDGMQVVGDQFTNASALLGDGLATLPDYPSEIRAPAGALFGVSGFQVCFGTEEIFNPGDALDILVAMNPAALRVNLPNTKEGAIIIANEDAFSAKNLEKAGYSQSPLQAAELSKYRVLRVPMSQLTQKAVESANLGLGLKQVDRCKNFFALGLVYSLFSRSKDYTAQWLKKKFRNKPEILQANLLALEAGWELGRTGHLLEVPLAIRPRQKALPRGVYRNVTGNTASALGLIAAARKAGRKLFLGSYPITPATEIMQELAKHKEFATVFQAEDEIAGVGSAVGAAFGGALAATSTSGPGFSLKTEFLGLAVIAELPLVVVNVQRAGPSTGLPTKTEQSDLLQAIFGRHGESPLVVLAAATPKDCFDATVEGARIALKYMTPVVVMTDGYLGNGSEVWRIPTLEELPEIHAPIRTAPPSDGGDFLPYERDPETLARYWALPGTPGLEHRLGGLEKKDRTGLVSHDPLNHQRMTELRQEKIARVASEIPPTEIYGDPKAPLLILGWGSTQGVIRDAVRKLGREGVKVASAHLRYLNPFPPDLKSVLQRYAKVLIPENNTGQLWRLIRMEYLINTEKLNKIQGQPFTAAEIGAKVRELLEVRK